MKNLLSFFLCFYLFTQPASLYAQNDKLKLGLDLGYTYSNRQANLSNFINSKYTPGYGMGINLTAEYLVWRTLFVSSGISFLQKNYKYERTGQQAGWYTKFTNGYLHVPLSVGGYLINNPYKNKGVWLKLSGGVYAEYWLSMRRDGQYPIITQPNSDGTLSYQKVSDRYDFGRNENRLRRFGFGLQGGGQLGYALKKIDLYTGYNYQYGFSDISKTNKDENQKMTTRSFMISFGIGYKL